MLTEDKLHAVDALLGAFFKPRRATRGGHSVRAPCYARQLSSVLHRAQSGTAPSQTGRNTFLNTSLSYCLTDRFPTSAIRKVLIIPYRSPYASLNQVHIPFPNPLENLMPLPAGFARCGNESSRSGTECSRALEVLPSSSGLSITHQVPICRRIRRDPGSSHHEEMMQRASVPTNLRSRRPSSSN